MPQSQGLKARMQPNASIIRKLQQLESHNVFEQQHFHMPSLKNISDSSNLLKIFKNHVMFLNPQRP
jgi:hypothetical protein